jgi:hypothetical protein
MCVCLGQIVAPWRHMAKISKYIVIHRNSKYGIGIQLN